VRPGVSVVIPTISGREQLLAEAVASVEAQTLRPGPQIIHVVKDVGHRGAGVARDAGLRKVDTKWVAFLDDDDVMYPEHLAVLMDAAWDADYVFAWYDVIDRAGRIQPTWDPLPHFGHPFDPQVPTQTTITVMVRTELAQEVGFLDTPEDGLVDGQRAGEDWRFTLGCVAAGARFLHVPRRTWAWRHWGAGSPGRPGNTSGMASRW